ncbi:MAG TPA: hypothetical protein VKA21_13915 [Candidatus Binatia bacterium]|nr:hypothetical protein [Candidatus Binatia bacterium]
MPRGLLTIALVAIAGGCGPSLPDPDTTGARVLRERCAGCHRVYAPGTMTLAMWDVQLERMRSLFARRGIPWLTADEERSLHDYLAAHAGRS